MSQFGFQQLIMLLDDLATQAHDGAIGLHPIRICEENKQNLEGLFDWTGMT